MVAMFNKRPKGLFGNTGPEVYATPGIGDGAMETAQQAPVGMAAPQDLKAGPKRPGFNDPGGWGERLYNIGGIMRDNDNGRTMENYQQLQMQRAREAQAIQQAQADRENKFTDWRRQYDYQRANPEPSSAQPYRWESNDGDVYQLGQDGQPQRVFDDPSPRMQFIPDGLGGGSWVSQGGGAPATPQDGRPAIGGVVDDPRKMGGGVGNGTGGFPR